MIVTLSRAELARLIDLSRKQRPELEDVYVWSCLNGWAIADVPGWTGTRAELYSLVQGRLYGPGSYRRRITCSST